MSFDLVQILQHMDAFALTITLVLVVMGVASLAVFFERLWAYGKAAARSRAFASVAATHLKAGNLDPLRQPPAEHAEAPLARLLSQGVEGFTEARADGAELLEGIDLASKAIARRRELINAELNRGLPVLASVGSVSPFVGLLGTVVGIIASFRGIAEEGSGGLGAVSGGIAEALVVTALGLVVAIPAVLAFNMLNTRLDRILLGLDHGAGELLDHLQRLGRRGERSSGGGGHVA